jgi:hypothetical protein
MTEAEYILETAAGNAIPAEPPDAPHSWDYAGRNVPAAKLDWTECLPFRQVRGVDLSPGRDGSPGKPGTSPET